MRRENPLLTRLRQVGWVAMAALGVLFLYLVFMVSQFRGLTDPNACDYAQIGRNLAQGKGFTTDFIKPLSLARVQKIADHPDLTYAPLHPALISLLLRLTGDTTEATDRAVALATGIPFLLSVIVVFVLGSQLFDTRAAWLAVALYATNAAFLAYAISGLEVCLLALLVSVLLLLLYGQGRLPQHRILLMAAAGIVFGLIYLTKYIWIAALVPVVVYLWYSVAGRQRRTVLAVFAITFVIVILPWCYRMYTVTGNPFFTFRWQEMIMQTRTNPGNTLYRSYLQDVPSFPAYLVEHPREIYEKTRRGTAEMYGVLATLAGPYLSAFFIVAIMLRLGSAGFERLRYLLYAMFACVFIALVFVLAAPRLLSPLAPIVTVISCGFFFRVLQQRLEPLPPKQHRTYLGLAIGVLVVLQVFPTALAITVQRRPGEEAPAREMIAWCQDVAQRTDGPIITDVPWLIAWYGQREAIWLPRTIHDLRGMERDFGKFKWLLLTPTVSRVRAIERTGDWVNAWQIGTRMDIAFEGFAVHRRLGDGSWILFKRVPGLETTGESAGEEESPPTVNPWDVEG